MEEISGKEKAVSWMMVIALGCFIVYLATHG